MLSDGSFYLPHGTQHYFRAGNRASAPNFGWTLVGKPSTSALRPAKGRPEFDAFPIRIRPKSTPEASSPARQHCCTTQGNYCVQRLFIIARRQHAGTVAQTPSRSGLVTVCYWMVRFTCERSPPTCIHNRADPPTLDADLRGSSEALPQTGPPGSGYASGPYPGSRVCCTQRPSTLGL